MPASQHGLLVAEGSAIRSVPEIKGKKVAFARGTSAQPFLLKLLAKAGLTYGDVEPIYLAPKAGASALSDGSVDAWAIWDPFFALAEKRQKVRVIATTKDIAHCLVCNAPISLGVASFNMLLIGFHRRGRRWGGSAWQRGTN